MSQQLPAGIDLSNLPPEVRRKVEAGLAKMSPELRRQWEQQGSPLLAKLVAGLANSAGPPPLPKKGERNHASSTGHSQTASRPGGMDLPAHPPHHVNPRSAPRGHYNDTIRPGDGAGMRWFPITVAVALALAWLLR